MNTQTIQPTVYTVSAGEHPKLLGTRHGTTRTVTSMRGATDPTKVARALTDADIELTRMSADPGFVTHLSCLGMRTAQLAPADGVLHLSDLADLPAPTGSAWASQPSHPACHIGTVLHAIAELPEAAARALRSELRAILAGYDGPVVPVAAWMGTRQGIFNAARWVDIHEAAVLDMLFGEFPDAIQAAEKIIWDYSADGAAFPRLAHELVAAEVDDFGVTYNLRQIIDRLAHARPEVLVRAIEETRSTGVDWDDEESYAYAVTAAANLPTGN